MKFNYALLLLVSLFSSNLYAIDSHNGIKFNMTLQHLENMNFSCSLADKHSFFPVKTICQDKKLKGSFFSHKTNGYRVGLNGINQIKILLTSIDLDFNKNTINHIEREIQKSYPERYTLIKNHSQKAFLWIDEEKSGVMAIEWFDKTYLSLFYQYPYQEYIFCFLENKIPENWQNKMNEIEKSDFVKIKTWSQFMKKFPTFADLFNQYRNEFSELNNLCNITP